MRKNILKGLLSAMLALVTLGALNAPIQANLTAPATTVPAPLTPIPAPAPVQNDFSDADFAAADQVELGETRGGRGRMTDEELIWIIAGAVLLLLLLIILIA